MKHESKYKPHQGKQEMARRVSKIRALQIKRGERVVTYLEVETGELAAKDTQQNK